MTAPITKRAVPIWTRFAVEPLAVPLARRLARLSWITPDRITVVAGLLAVGSAACFAAGSLRVGGALFVVRYFVDCLDGKVARARGTTSHRGAALDLVVDVAGIGACAAALGWSLVRDEDLSVAVATFLLAAIVVYNFVLAYRKGLADQLGLETDGGTRRTLSSGLPLVRSWIALARRLDMNPVPYAVEAEIASFGLVPLLASGAVAADVLPATLAFYVLASAVNVRRVLRLASDLDRRETGAGRG